MSDFLLELRCEEIPARMQAKARIDLEKLFTANIKNAGLEATSIITYSTPRRLILIARGLPSQTDAVREERKGPRADAPDQALAGFLRSTGLNREDLVERDVKGKAVLFAIVEKPAQPTVDILSSAIPAIISAFPWPKSQRWGADSISSESLRWVRPLSGIIALLDDDLIDCEVGGIKSDRMTMGHRFHSSGEIAIDNADDYAKKLRDAYVIVDHIEREGIIRDGAAKAASDAGLSLVADEGLVIENAGLTEWPVPLLGRFDEAFLDVPEEVIQLTTKINQKYFVVRDSKGALTNMFICTANIDAADSGKEIIGGNEKVLAARLGDAKFFWELDQKTTLAEHAEKLSNIVFHEKLGTVADKVERVAKLARWLCEQGIVNPAVDNSIRHAELGSASAENNEASNNETLKQVQGDDALVQGDDALVQGNELSSEELADLAEQAARLCKADLVTEMVGEFPELQGLMGGYYVAKEGLPIEVSNAIRDHYKPVGQNDDVPTDPVTVAVSLADKLDTIFGFFGANILPTGSKDPFALRRAALAVIRLCQDNNLRLNMLGALDVIIENVEPNVYQGFNLHISESHNEVDDYEHWELLKSIATPMLEFFSDRLKVQQKEAGIRYDLIDAVLSKEADSDIVRMVSRIHVLNDFIATDEGVALLASYKRAANVLKQSRQKPDAEVEELETKLLQIAKDKPDNEYVFDAFFDYKKEVEEQALYNSLLNINIKHNVTDKWIGAFINENYQKHLSISASLSPMIDAFFDKVMVNDGDPLKRLLRLTLLISFTKNVDMIADFAKIEG